jgi:GT2 family glycosyltransferase
MPKKSADPDHDPRMAGSGEGADGATDELDRSAVELQHVKAELHDARFDLATLMWETDRVRDELAGLYSTRSFWYLARLRRLYNRAHRALLSAPPPPRRVLAPLAPWPLLPLVDAAYRTWVDRFDTLDDAARTRIARQVDALDTPPTFSIVMPVHDPDPEFLTAALESVRQQIYPHWELCVADDASVSAEVVELVEEAAEADPRIKLVRRTKRGHISVATNSALALARHTWVAFLDHDDVLAEHALALVALAVVAHPMVKLVFSDEDKLDAEGRRSQPYFKPDFDPVLLLGQNYLAHLRVVRRDVLERLGGCREGFEGSQDWDLHLRLAEILSDDEVVHIPRVLYHWRIHAGSAAATVEAKPYAKDSGARAITQHLERTGRPGRLFPVLGGWWRVGWAVPDPAPLVTVIICTRDGEHLRRCLESLWLRTTYSRFEVLIVDNRSVRADTQEVLALAGQRGARVRRDPRPFNFSALNNDAVKEATGELVCFLNDDIEVITPEWLEEMVGQISQAKVAAVGAKLYFPDGKVQHAGVAIGRGGVASHLGRDGDRLDMGYFGHSALARQCSAVTAAAMLIRRDVFESVGGFDEVDLAVAFNDVDLCVRLRQAGWRVVWTPFAEHIHHESATRGLDNLHDPRFAKENALMERRWGYLFAEDPFFNVNLDLDEAGTVVLACPPRTPPL